METATFNSVKWSIRDAHSRNRACCQKRWSVRTASRASNNEHARTATKDFGPRSPLRIGEAPALRFGQRRHRWCFLVIVGGELSTTIELPQVALAETWDEFDVEEHFAFATLLIYDDASHVGDDARNVGC